MSVSPSMSSPSPRASARRRTIAALLAAALSVAPGCTQEPVGPRNLLLITIDTLRHDRLGFAGHERETSPAIDRLARKSVRFERSYSQAGWTLPSLASVMTGRHPRRHGAVDFASGVDPTLPTLATLLSGEGYDTRAFVSHILLRPRYGLARGFAEYDASVLRVGNPHEVATAEPLTEKAVHALSEVEPPFFLWVHYFDPHFNYLRHPEWAGLGSTALDRYDGEIAHTDRSVGLLLDALRDSGHQEETVIVLTADHGEAFGERGEKFHYSLDEGVTRIPLMIRAPGLAPGARRELTQQVDLLPTVLPLVGFAPPASAAGRDLLAPADEPPVVFMERVDPYLQRSVIRGSYKLVVAELAPGKEAPEMNGLKVRTGTFLFDLDADPTERVNLVDREPELARSLLTLLEEETRTPERRSSPIELDAELAEKLRNLGYTP